MDSGESSEQHAVADAVLEDYISRFNDLDDHLSFDTSAEAISSWLHHMDIEPEELVDIINSDIPLSIKTSLNLSDDGSGDVVCDLNNRRNQAGVAERVFSIPNKWIFHQLFSLQQPHQNKGIGRNFIRNWVHIYRWHWNLEKIFVKAGLTHGGYVWLRYGFVPNQDSWDMLRPKVLRRLHEKIDEIETVVFDIANDTLSKINPESAWIIADLAQPVDGQPLGRYLLAGLSWSGELDLTDELALNRLLRYVGELK